MKLRVEKRGDDFVVRIPEPLAVQSGIREGTEIETTVLDGNLVLRFPRSQLRLEDLLKRVTPDRIHGGIDFGPPVGKEVW